MRFFRARAAADAIYSADQRLLCHLRADRRKEGASEFNDSKEENTRERERGYSSL